MFGLSYEDWLLARALIIGVLFATVYTLLLYLTYKLGRNSDRS